MDDREKKIGGTLITKPSFNQMPLKRLSRSFHVVMMTNRGISCVSMGKVIVLYMLTPHYSLSLSFSTIWITNSPHLYPTQSFLSFISPSGKRNSLLQPGSAWVYEHGCTLEKQLCTRSVHPSSAHRQENRERIVQERTTEYKGVEESTTKKK